jgi:LuxR family quorum sensing-dependent transcriptional regulator
MLLTDNGAELVDHLERQRDIPSLLASFQRLVLAHGMDCFCIGDPAHPDVQRDDRRWGATWPFSWWWRYVSQNHIAHDPIVARLNHSPLPFRWSETHALANRRGRDVLGEAAEFGLTDGLALAIHGEGTVGAVSIAARHYELSPHQRAGLQLAAYYLHARVASLRAKGPTPTPRVLAPRERECLNWVAAGKTDWEIAQILNIAAQTAHGYVQSAMSKLGARTRAQAVALALLSSQIQM